MKKSIELIKNTIIILLGKVCTQFLSFFLLPLYTSILSSEEYGIFDLITTYVTLIVPIITLQLEMALFREIIDSRNDEKKKRNIISSGFVSIFIQFIFCLLIFFIVSRFINIPYKNYLVLNVLSVMSSNILLQIARGNGDNVGYSLGSVIAGVITIILNLVFLIIFKFRVDGMLLAATIANFMASVFLFFRLKIYSYFKIKFANKQTIFSLLKYSFPLVPNGLIWWVINVSDRTLISLFLGASANGLYAVSNKFSTILIQVYNVFNLSWTESASLHIDDDDKDKFFSDTFNTTISVFYSICIMFVAILPMIFNIFVNDSYNEAYLYIPILLIGMMFNICVSFIGCIYVAKKLTKEVAITSFWSGLLNIIINVALIKKTGIYAAAISTVLAFMIMSIYRYIDVQKYVKLKIKPIKLFLLTCLFVIECLVYYLNIKILSLASAILSIILLVFLNRESLVSLFSKIRSKN